MSLVAALRFIEARPDLCYSPGPTVGAFQRSASRLAVLVAANQIGKTVGLAKWCWDRCLAWDGEGPGTLLVMIADIVNQYAVFCAKMWEVAPRSELHSDCRYVDGKGFYTSGRRMVKLANGAHMEFRGGKGEQMASASVTCDLGVAVDEIPFRAHFAEAMRAAQRYMAPVRVGFTAVGRPADWFRERVVGLEGRPPTDVHPATGAPMWEVFQCGLSVEECPWLTQEQIDEIMATVDPDEAPQRLRGEWEGPTSDRRFNGMSSERVLTEVPPGDYSVTVAMDHGEGAGRQHAVLLFHNGTTAIVADEYVNTDATTPEVDVRGIDAMLRRNGMGLLSVDRWVGDVNSAGKSNAGASVNEAMEAAFADVLGTRRCPFRIEKPNKSAGSVAFGERLLNYALHRGDLDFHERATRTVRAFWHYRGPRDEDQKHPVDAVRYGLHDVYLARPDYARLYLRH